MKTIVFGASLKEERYSNKAIVRLRDAGHEVIPIGLREGVVAGIEVLKGYPQINGAHTITLYLNQKRQKEHYEYFFNLKPKRIIFNPGAENEELFLEAESRGIEAIEACTLVMLSIGNY